MPENTIVSSSNEVLRQLDNRQQQSQLQEGVKGDINTEGTQSAASSSTPVALKVDISKESIELALNSGQQVKNSEAVIEAQNQTAQVRSPAAGLRAQTAEQTPLGFEAGIQSSNATLAADSADPAQQFNPSANKALGTVIDVFS